MSDALELTWVASPQMEAHLKAIGVSFEVKEFAPGEFSLNESKKLQTRFDKRIDETHAFNLAVDIERTKHIEYLVAVSPEIGFKGLLFADGLHRVTAFDEHLEEQLPDGFKYMCYYIDTKDQKIRELIFRSCNCVAVKKCLSHEERVRHIKYMITAYPAMSIADVAVIFHEDPARIQKELSIDQERQDLLAAGIITDALTPSHIQVLQKIKTNDHLKHQFARVAIQCKSNVTQTKQAVDDILKISKKSGEAAAMEQIGKYKKDWLNAVAQSPKTPAKGKRAPARTKLFNFVGSFLHFMNTGDGDGKPYQHFPQLDVTDPSDVSNFRAQFKELRKLVEDMGHNWDTRNRRK